MEHIVVKTSRRVALVDITDDVQSVVSRQKIMDGLCLVFCPHTTAGLTVNENADPSVQDDISSALSALVPPDAGYTHREGNSDSHIKSSLFGPSLSLIVEGGKLMLGTWQGIYLCESDGPRQRQVWVKMLGV